MNADTQPASLDGVPPAPALPDGHRLGNFELQSVWQRSGAGLVYRAWDHALVRPVAVKEYLPAAWGQRDPNGDVRPLGPGSAAEFERGCHAFVDEARTLAHCDHPSLVRVLELLKTGGTAYRVMPWYACRSLLDVRRKMTGPIGEPALRALLDELLGALQTYQRVGDVHRGIHPSQVLLLDEDRAMLLGPGAASRAQHTGPADAPGPRADTAFMPPEQARPGGQPQGPWTDFYALAALARFCITGVPPPPAGPDAPEPLAAAVERMFAHQQPGVRFAAPLLDALDAAMAPDIAMRPQTVAQFRELLLGTSRRQAAPATASVHTVDAATQDLIRRVIDSIDEPGGAAPGAEQDGVATWHADPADRNGLDLARKAPAKRRHRALQAVVGLAMMAAVGFGTVDLQWQPFGVAGASWLPVAKLRVPELNPSTISTSVEAPPTHAAALPQRAVPVAPAPASAPLAAAAAPSDPRLLIAKAPGEPLALDAAPAVKVKAVARSPLADPRQECGARTAFSLYRCMQQQCALARWQRHPQCVQLEATDSVD